MTRIYFIRHGFSMANVEGMVAGQSDVDLAPLGIEQAEQTALFLKDVSFSCIYSSDLIRARKTAEPHLQYHDVPLFYRSDLRELNLGVWEKQPRALFVGKDPEFDKFWTEFITARVPGGDVVEEAGRRFYKTVCEIAAKHDGQTILIVTHAGFLRAMIGTALGIAPDAYRADLPFATNASVQIMDYTDGALSLVAYSLDEHIRSKTGF